AGSMHSNTSIKITGGKLNTYDGKLYSADPSAVTFNKDEDKYWYKDDDGKKKKMSFPNNSIVKANGGVEAIDYKMLATAAPSTENNIQPGMYQWHRASDCPAGKNYYELRYYPGDDGSTKDASGRPVPRISSLYEIVTVGDVSEEEETGGAEDDGQTHKKCAMGPAGKIGFVTNSEGRITEPTLILNGKLHCDGNLTISTDVGEVKRVLPKVQIGKYTPVGSNGKPISKKAEEGVLNASGDITLVSTVKGNGAVVTYNGDVSFVGSSVLDSGSDGVAIYANNINLGNMELITTETPDGKTLDTSSGSGSQVTVDSDGNKTFTPSAEDMFCILGEFCTNSNGSLNLENAKTKIREYFAERFGVRIEVMNGWNLGSDPGTPIEERIFGYSIKIKFLTEAGGNADSNEYTIHTKTVGGGSPELYMCLSYTREDVPNPQIDTITAPAAAVMEDFEDPDDDDGGNGDSGTVVNPAKDIVKKFGNVCYGDQVLNGVVYARNNFKAMLSKKYKLVINGAVRAEKGSIQAECSGVDLTYDESCLKKLLPTYSKLNREMWNCW
ncbi:hypothetical protein IJT17_03000, partial [bacterium]|nr:hypothetical protein [bacterium]